jgi:hypothetical protein
MTTTNQQTGVTASLAQLAKDLTEQLLQGRRIWLRHRAPKSPYVHQLRRDLAAERKKSVEFLLAISFSDIDDGLPPSVASQMYRSAIALIEERAQQRALARGEPVVGPDPLALVQRESAAQAVKDDAEREFIDKPMSADALQRVLDADARYDAENDKLVNVVRSRLAHLRLQAI